ncbi:MAG: TFIIB-type zinc ribbon-containing protein [Oscillospiraceae bacterium]|nr:TFIIB-type zinc ribbon-containing protein [Oscillospiraceae bacterium]
MKLIPAVCPNCGASLDLDPERKFSFCPSCGTKIIIDDEVQRLQVQHTVRLDQSAVSQNYFSLAQSAFQSRNYGEAYQYYTKYLESDLSNAVALFYKGLSAAYLGSGASRFPELTNGLSAALHALRGQLAKPTAREPVIREYYSAVHAFFLEKCGEALSRSHTFSYPSQDALLEHLNFLSNMGDTLSGLILLIPSDVLVLSLPCQTLKQSFCKLGLQLYEAAGLPTYTYVSARIPLRGSDGSIVYRDSLSQYRPSNLAALKQARQFLVDQYNTIPSILQQKAYFEAQCTRCEQIIATFDRSLSEFFAQFPAAATEYKSISFFGRRKKQDAFLRTRLPEPLPGLYLEKTRAQAQLATLRREQQQYLSAAILPDAK